MDKYLLLSWKRFGLIIAAFIVGVLLHNLVSALIGKEEGVFFIITVIIIPVYFVVSLIYSLVKKIRKQ